MVVVVGGMEVIGIETVEGVAGNVTILTVDTDSFEVGGSSVDTPVAIENEVVIVVVGVVAVEVGSVAVAEEGGFGSESS